MTESPPPARVVDGNYMHVDYLVTAEIFERELQCDVG